MIAYQPFQGHPRHEFQLAQAPAQVPAPTPPSAPPPKAKPGPLAYIAVGTVGGALTGLIASFVLPALSKKKEKMDWAKRGYAALGGAVGGLGGAVTGYALFGN